MSWWRRRYTALSWSHVELWPDLVLDSDLLHPEYDSGSIDYRRHHNASATAAPAAAPEAPKAPKPTAALAPPDNFPGGNQYPAGPLLD